MAKKINLFNFIGLSQKTTYRLRKLKGQSNKTENGIFYISANQFYDTYKNNSYTSVVISNYRSFSNRVHYFLAFRDLTEIF